MPFATTWMDLEIIILSEVSQTKTVSYDTIYMYVESKNDTNELIYKTETDSQQRIKKEKKSLNNLEHLHGYHIARLRHEPSS